MNKIPKPPLCYRSWINHNELQGTEGDYAGQEELLLLALLHAVHDDGSVGAVDAALGDIKEYAPHLIEAAQQESTIGDKR